MQDDGAPAKVLKVLIADDEPVSLNRLEDFDDPGGGGPGAGTLHRIQRPRADALVTGKAVVACFDHGRGSASRATPDGSSPASVQNATTIATIGYSVHTPDGYTTKGWVARCGAVNQAPKRADKCTDVAHARGWVSRAKNGTKNRGGKWRLVP